MGREANTGTKNRIPNSSPQKAPSRAPADARPGCWRVFARFLPIGHVTIAASLDLQQLLFLQAHCELEASIGPIGRIEFLLD
jgi:hypothetical protein